MGKKLIGKKLGMTRYFVEDGVSVPVTIIKAGPCVVIQKKSSAKDGYGIGRRLWWPGEVRQV